MSKEKEVEVLRVAGDTSVHKLSGAIAGVISKGNTCEIVSIGAGALNQATKAAIIARKMLSPSGVNFAFIPAFVTINLAKEKDAPPEEVTGIKLISVII